MRETLHVAIKPVVNPDAWDEAARKLAALAAYRAPRPPLRPRRLPRRPIDPSPTIHRCDS